MNQAILKLINNKTQSLILFEKIILFPACDLLSTELWPSLQEKIQEYIQSNNIDIATKALQFCTLLFENATGSQIGEVFIMFIKGLEEVKMNVHFDSHSIDYLVFIILIIYHLYFQNLSNLPTKTIFLLNCGKALSIMLQALPNHWLYFSDILMKDIYFITVSMICNHFQLLINRLNEHSNSFPACIFIDQNCHLADVDLFHSLLKTTPFLLLCIVDPVASWFENWLQTSASRDSIFSFLSHSQLPKVFQLVIIKFIKSRDVLSRIFALHNLSIFWKIVEFENGKQILSGETIDYFNYYSEYSLNNSSLKMQFKNCNWNMHDFWKSIRFGSAVNELNTETFALITGFDYINNIMELGKTDIEGKIDLYYLNSLAIISNGIYNLLLNCRCLTSSFSFIFSNIFNIFKINEIVFVNNSLVLNLVNNFIFSSLVVVLSRANLFKASIVNHKSILYNILEPDSKLDLLSSLNYFVQNALNILIKLLKLDEERLIYSLDSIIGIYYN